MKALFPGIDGIEVQPIAGSEKCTFGPSFWCTSLENAKRCGQGV